MVLEYKNIRSPQNKKARQAVNQNCTCCSLLLPRAFFPPLGTPLAVDVIADQDSYPYCGKGESEKWGERV